MRETINAARAIRGLPLCVKYSAIHVVVVGAQLVGGSCESGALVALVLGAQPCGRPDLLGAWPATDLGPAQAFRIVDDLVERGLQRTTVVVNGASEDLSRALQRSFPGASLVFPFHLATQMIGTASAATRRTIERGLGQVRRAESQEHANAVLDALAASGWRGTPVAVKECRAAIEQCAGFYTLPWRARDRLRGAEDAVWALQQAVSKVLARHGPFETADAAVVLVEEWFGKTERRDRRQRLAEDRRLWLARA